MMQLLELSVCLEAENFADNIKDLDPASLLTKM
jgi:hypothetical protein